MRSTDTPSVAHTLGETLSKSAARESEPADSHLKRATTNGPERISPSTARSPAPSGCSPVDKMDPAITSAHDDENLDSIIESYISDVVSKSSTEPGDLFENPKGKPTSGNSQGSTTPEKLKVLGKRLDAGRPQYLIQHWVYPKKGGAANLYLDRCLRKYDGLVSQDLTEQGLL
ncbi:hypothetical protein RBB50_012856 [Rhinocladiella similis]